MGKPSQVGAASVVENSSHTPLSPHTPDSRFPFPSSEGLGVGSDSRLPTPFS
ncbi:hypothetical protein [Moorena sp. SIO3I6]|uniref:hypothetical protein n=1 Tax=Moorena sp. SIO3I6 TaxID=2607831 RepID=UPI0025F9E074|nr:hypothetical protein [Moorena sp. SIO3I6]